MAVDPASGCRPYALNQTLLVHEWRGTRPAPGSGATFGPPVKRLVRTDPETRKLVVKGLPEPWAPPLLNAQRRRMRAMLTAMGVPLPRALVPEEGK